MIRRLASVLARFVARSEQANFRGIPTAACPSCGGDLFTVQVVFDDEYNIGLYLLDCSCAYCGTKLTAPTPLDLPD